MIAFLILLGFYFLLWLPWLGQILGHGVLHVIAHLAEHHADAVLNILGLCCWILIPLWVLFAVWGYWWGMADVFVGVLILWKLFAPFRSNHPHH